MDVHYLLEIRITGEPKFKARDLIYDVQKKFKVYGAVKYRPVPHMTLFGPFNCESIQDVVRTIEEVASEFSELHYEIDGFDYFEIKKKFLFITTSSKKNVIYLKIKPGEDLKDLRHKLAKRLLKIANGSEFDPNSKNAFKFHTTVAMKDIDQKFDSIWEYLKGYEIKSQGVACRITLVRQDKIMYEYDLPTKRLLNRSQALRRTSDRGRAPRESRGGSRPPRRSAGRGRAPRESRGGSRTPRRPTGRSRTPRESRGRSRTPRSSRGGRRRTERRFRR